MALLYAKQTPVGKTPSATPRYMSKKVPQIVKNDGAKIPKCFRLKKNRMSSYNTLSKGDHISSQLDSPVSKRYPLTRKSSQYAFDDELQQADCDELFL